MDALCEGWDAAEQGNSACYGISLRAQVKEKKGSGESESELRHGESLSALCAHALSPPALARHCPAVLRLTDLLLSMGSPWDIRQHSSDQEPQFDMSVFAGCAFLVRRCLD